jgi:hypothetical protein
MSAINSINANPYINTTSATNTSGTSALQDLAATLLKGFDSNGDGKLSSDEFSSLITGLAQQFGVDANATAAAYSTSVATKPIVSTATDFGSVSSKFEGFDLGRAQDPSKSAKDAFAMLAAKSGSVPATKAEAETWFNSKIKSEFEALGHKVNWVSGDKMSFTNWQGTYEIDFIRGADGPNPAYTWLVEGA